MNAVEVTSGSATPTSGKRNSCCHCMWREHCLPAGLDAVEIEHFDRIVYQRRSLRRGEHLYRPGMAFHFLFAVYGGFLKSYVGHASGNGHVTGFHMVGEILGADGIDEEQHTSSVVALEDSYVCAIPFDGFLAVAREIPILQRNFLRTMSREIVRDHQNMALLGSSRAEERVAAFLHDVSQRLHQRGYSGREFILRMTREEIGGHLGLQLETVSRALSSLRQEGIVAVHKKLIKIIGAEGLRAIAGRQDACASQPVPAERRAAMLDLPMGQPARSQPVERPSSIGTRSTVSLHSAPGAAQAVAAYGSS